jgi:cysteine-rich repeat protein
MQRVQTIVSSRFGCALLAALACLSPRPARALCGDGVIELPAAEACDDGNVISRDGCSSSCQVEAGYTCIHTPSACCFGEATRGFALRGAATYDERSGAITLSPQLPFRAGAAWYRQPLDFSRSFSVAFQLYLGNRDDNPSGNATDPGADGVALVFQRDPRGSAAEGTIESEFGDFGARFAAEGIAPLLAVEFDTFNNGPAYGDGTLGDEDHVGIFHTGATPAANQLTSPACMNEGPTCKNYEDDRFHAVVVSWSAAPSNELSVSIDGLERVALVEDLTLAYFAGDPRGIWFGFTGGTGDSYNLQMVCPGVPSGFGIPRDFDLDGSEDSIDADDDNDATPDRSDPAPLDPCSPSPLSCEPAEVDAGAPPDASMTLVPLDAATLAPPVDAAWLPDARALDAAGVAEAGLPRAAAPAAPSCADAPGGLACSSADSDGDGVQNQIDSAPDDPCLPDAQALGCALGDRDGDGLRNELECPGLTACRDTDADGVADYADADADGDGKSDRSECPDPNLCANFDSDADGIPDVLDGLPPRDGDGCSVHFQNGSASASTLGWLLAALIASLVARRTR